eukprot:363149-Chlamydomonas_euryale.AAC.5
MPPSHEGESASWSTPRGMRGGGANVCASLPLVRRGRGANECPRGDRYVARAFTVLWVYREVSRGHDRYVAVAPADSLQTGPRGGWPSMVTAVSPREETWPSR